MPEPRKAISARFFVFPAYLFLCSGIIRKVRQLFREGSACGARSWARAFGPFYCISRAHSVELSPSLQRIDDKDRKMELFWGERRHRSTRKFIKVDVTTLTLWISFIERARFAADERGFEGVWENASYSPCYHGFESLAGYFFYLAGSPIKRRTYCSRPTATTDYNIFLVSNYSRRFQIDLLFDEMWGS